MNKNAPPILARMRLLEGSKKTGDGIGVNNLVFDLEALCLDHFITFQCSW